MVRSDAHDPVLPGESLYAIITIWATSAKPRVLALTLGISAALAAALLLINREVWPLAAISFTIATISAWGLLDQFAPKPRARVISAVEWALVGIGILAAVAAGLGILFWVLGPAPIL